MLEDSVCNAHKSLFLVTAKIQPAVPIFRYCHAEPVEASFRKTYRHNLSSSFAARMLEKSACNAHKSLFLNGANVLNQDRASNFSLMKSLAKIKAEPMLLSTLENSETK